MRTINVKLFNFSELSEEAKVKACEEYRNRGYEPVWTAENRQTLEAFEKIFPINVTNWSYGGRGEGVSFSIIGEHIEEVSGQRLATYLWNNYARDLFKGKYYGCVEVKKLVKHKRVKNPKDYKNGNFFNPYYSAITLDNSCVLTGYYLDNEILDPIYEFLDNPTKGTTFEDLLNDCFNAWIKACNDDVESQNTDEYIGEHMEANDYEFEEDGTIH